MNLSFLFVLIGYTRSCLHMEANISTFLNLKISRAQGGILPIQNTAVKRHILFKKKKKSLLSGWRF